MDMKIILNKSILGKIFVRFFVKQTENFENFDLKCNMIISNIKEDPTVW